MSASRQHLSDKGQHRLGCRIHRCLKPVARAADEAGDSQPQGDWLQPLFSRVGKPIGGGKRHKNCMASGGRSPLVFSAESVSALDPCVELVGWRLTRDCGRWAGWAASATWGFVAVGLVWKEANRFFWNGFGWLLCQRACRRFVCDNQQLLA